MVANLTTDATTVADLGTRSTPAHRNRDEKVHTIGVGIAAGRGWGQGIADRAPSGGVSGDGLSLVFYTASALCSLEGEGMVWHPGGD
jgi:hypothetical protein